MFDTKLLIVTCAGVLAYGAAVFAQMPAPQPPQSSTTAAPSAGTTVPDGGEPRYLRPETPEQRKARLGTAEDPGPDPDPKKQFWRFGRFSHIEKFDRRWENYEGCEPGFVRPYGFVNLQREIYQLNDKWVWVWMPDRQPEELPPPQPESRYNDEQLNYLQNLRSEFSELAPKANSKTVRFQEASSGLPTTGSWRNSLAIADMNGDGCPDIIAPPERKGGGAPAIFLGDCKGHWRFWSKVKWPRGVDYGSVVTADFNKDGAMDLAFGVHLRGIFVMLGDGKGNFKEVTQGLPRDFATRRIVINDVDHDGYPDIVGISEGPAAPQATAVQKGRLRVYFNRRKGMSWEETDVAGPEKHTAGDWLTVADLTGDRRPDMIAANIYMNGIETIYLNDGPKKWKPVSDPYLVPYLSLYHANAAGKFSSKKSDDAIVSYTRVWPSDLPTIIVPDPPSKNIVGIDRLTLAGKQPKRTPIVRWSGSRLVAGVAVGDFDGDGNLDLIYTRFDPREAVILLGDGKGGFTRAAVDGLTLDSNPNYDIHVADVNGDGQPDVILMYESSTSTVLAEQNGSIRVFLNRGGSAATAQAQK